MLTSVIWHLFLEIGPISGFVVLELVFGSGDLDFSSCLFPKIQLEPLQNTVLIKDYIRATLWQKCPCQDTGLEIGEV